MPKKHEDVKHDDIVDLDPDMDDLDDDPIPAKRDIRIFHRKKDKDEDPGKDEDFEEDVFV